MNRSPIRRVLLAALALLLGAGGVFAIVRYVQSSEERALAGQELAEVYVVTRPVEVGTPAAVVVDAVSVERVPVAYRAEGAVTDIDALGALVTNAELVPGEQLLTSRFDPPEARTVAGGATSVPDGLLEVTVEITADRGVGAQIRPGEFVAVVVTFDAFGPTPAIDGAGEPEVVEVGVGGPVRNAQSHFLLRRVLVTNIQSQTPLLLPEGEEGERSRTPPSGTILVTLALEPGQVEPLVFATEFGKLWLARDPALAPVDSTPVISYDNVFTGDLFPGPGEGTSITVGGSTGATGPASGGDGTAGAATDGRSSPVPTPAPGEDPPPETLADTGGSVGR